MVGGSRDESRMIESGWREQRRVKVKVLRSKQKRRAREDNEEAN